MVDISDDSEDPEKPLSNPLWGLRKPKSHLSSQDGTADDCNISILITYTICSNNNPLNRSKLSLTQRRRLSHTFLENEAKKPD